jgi:hypothetical protein
VDAREEEVRVVDDKGTREGGPGRAEIERGGGSSGRVATGTEAPRLSRYSLKKASCGRWSMSGLALRTSTALLSAFTAA